MARFDGLEQGTNAAPPGGGRSGLGIAGARKLAAAIVGGTLIAFGVLMLVLPGPGMLAIGAGLAALAAEFEWARRLLRRAKRQAQALVGKAGPSKS